MSEPAESESSQGPSARREAPRPTPAPHAASAMSGSAPAPTPDPLPVRRMQAIERELGVRRHRIASSPGVLAGPPMVPDEATLARLMSVWRFDDPQSTWASEAQGA